MILRSQRAHLVPNQSKGQQFQSQLMARRTLSPSLELQGRSPSKAVVWEALGRVSGEGLQNQLGLRKKTHAHTGSPDASGRDVCVATVSHLSVRWW